MDKNLLDPSELHDQLEQNLDENTASDMLLEHIVGADPVVAAEESAMHTDNETARTMNNIPRAEEQEDIAPKKKGRESTSEKAKRAATERVAKGKTAEPVATKKLDPLRLRGKKYRAVIAKVEKHKLYTLEEAVALVKEVSTSKFPGSLEVHLKVKGDATRGTVVLPHGTGKTKKVAVADDDTIEAIAAGKLDFDVLLATPAQMPKLAKFAKLLGPKGLMPSPKAGTVTDDIEKVKAEIGGGRIEYRADKTGVIHLGIGYLSFTNEQLIENFRSFEAALTGSKVISVSLAPTMGPGVRVQVTK